MKTPARIRQPWAVLFLSLVYVCGGMSCTRSQSGPNPVSGVITPEYFRFRVTVPNDDPEEPAGGWRAVCIHAQFKHGDSDAKTVCKFEVGIPLKTEKQGVIPLEAAQFAAASLANRAAREVLSQAHPGEMFAVLCTRFKTTYELMLGAQYAGARVGTCTTKEIETVTFGIESEEEPAP
jgi:hypothetical protein